MVERALSDAMHEPLGERGQGRPRRCPRTCKLGGVGEFEQVACGDGAVDLEMTEHALDAVALAV